MKSKAEVQQRLAEAQSYWYSYSGPTADISLLLTLATILADVIELLPDTPAPTVESAERGPDARGEG